MTYLILKFIVYKLKKKQFSTLMILLPMFVMTKILYVYMFFSACFVSSIYMCHMIYFIV